MNVEQEKTNPIFRQRSDSTTAEGIIAPKDEGKLAELGYKQELARTYGRWEVFSVAFSIMSLVPAIASTMLYAISAGGVGLTWGWFVPMAFILTVAFMIATFASAMPTAGAMYYWTFKVAPVSSRKFLSYLSGWSDMAGLWAGCASVLYGFTLQLLASVQLGMPNYVSTNGEAYGVFAAANIAALVLCYLPNRIMSKIQLATVYVNAIVLILIVIALPVGLKHNGLKLNSGSEVFGQTSINETGYPYGWAFMLAWMSAVWTCSTLDTSCHMAESTKRAETAIPFSVMMSTGLCFVGGFLVTCIFAAVIDWDDIDTILSAELPLAVIIQRCLGSKWGLAFQSLFCAIQFFQGVSTMYANSHQCYALARDRAMPLSKYLAKVDKRGNPFFASIATCLVSCALGLLILAGKTAAYALFNMSVTALYMSWSLPIWLFTWRFDMDTFKPGPFWLGPKFTRAVGVVASVFCVFIIFVLSLLPSAIPVDEPAMMNWSVVVVVGVWVLAIGWYFIYARKVYEGPVSTLSDLEYAEVLDGDEKAAAATADPSKEVGDARSISE